MFVFSRKILNLHLQNRLQTSLKVLQSQIRKSSGSYHGDGRTKVQILNDELDLGLMINSFSQVGFRLNIGMKVIGPMAIFPKSVLSWNVVSEKDINEETLSLFLVLDPKIEVLVLGTGDSVVTPDISAKINAIARKYKINVEILTTEAACATFNFLNAEQRLVAGALIPPTLLRITEDDVAITKARHNELYISDEMT